MSKIVFFLALLSQAIATIAQVKCDPPAADSASGASVLCDIRSLNGFCCKNTDYSNPSGCSPLCPAGGGPHNTGWWAFVGRKGEFTIQCTFSNCSVNGTGVQFGIWGDPYCSESIVCNPACNGPGTYTMKGILPQTKVYYFFVDGCSGDVCDFCLSTQVSGLDSLNLEIKEIKGLRTQCPSNCPRKYTVSGIYDLDPSYIWELDGNFIPFTDSIVFIDLFQSGIYELCATAYIGNLDKGEFCARSAKYCIEIEVKPPEEHRGEDRQLCPLNLPFYWHNLPILSSGVYRRTFFSRPDCCQIDSVVYFEVVNDSDWPVYYDILCDSLEFFLDTITQERHYNCLAKDRKSFGVKSSSDECDSTYSIKLIKPEYAIRFFMECRDSGNFLGSQMTNKTQKCTDIEFMPGFRYKWFDSKDPLRKSLSDSSYLKVDSPGEYCLELSVFGKLGPIQKSCEFTYCENLDERYFYPYRLCPIGSKVAIAGQTSVYVLDNLIPNYLNSFHWSVQGGRIVNSAGQTTSEFVKIIWDPDVTEGKICYHYLTQCASSDTCCLNLTILTGSTDQTSHISISLFPNPIMEGSSLLIKSESNMSEIVIRNGNGAMMKVDKLVGKNNGSFYRVDIPEHLPNGLYFAQIKCENAFTTKKFVVMR
jgi:hypothetical protein